MVLDAIDTSLRQQGWVVASLIFDGCHVEHRDGGDLTRAMRIAEQAVLDALGYKIELKEKPLYQMADATDVDIDENDAGMDNEDE